MSDKESLEHEHHPDYESINLENPAYYQNRELSWLSFNRRVLAEAEDPSNPLLEQLNFLSIGTSNLDEFFMVRVAGLQDQLKLHVNERDTKTQLSPDEQLEAISVKNRENLDYQYGLLKQKKQELAEHGIFFKRMKELNDNELEHVKEIFNNQYFPALSPYGIDAYRPFPRLNNLLLHVLVRLKKHNEVFNAIVPIPGLIDRVSLLENGDEKVVLFAEDIISHFIDRLFTGYEVTQTLVFRITRNADFEIQEAGAEDLLSVIEDYLVKRKNGRAVRLEVDTRDMDPSMEEELMYLVNELDILERDVYRLDGPLDLTVLSKVTSLLKPSHPDWVYPPFKPVTPPEFQGATVYEQIDKQDIFLHHPYDSFQPVLDFILEAVDDPNTIAIKQTLYRVSSDSPIIEALSRAAEKGTQVTALVELKARFDEESNVHWAKQLEEAGCQVLYGMRGLKTHSKATLVVKKESGRIKRYAHLSTGNYNDQTAKLYTDMGLLTADDSIVQDVTEFFNYLSGYSEQPDYQLLHVSPYEIRDTFFDAIEEEIQLHKEHGNGHIIAKMNSLTDKKIILKLFDASRVGVKVELIIRGICCLIPGIPGVSENITVHSVVGRFLEHSRVYYFHHNGRQTLYLSSADMMTRNMVKRVEIAFPIEDNDIKQEVLDILQLFLTDNTKAWELQSDGHYQKASPKQNEQPLSAQQALMEKAVCEAH